MASKFGLRTYETAIITGTGTYTLDQGAINDAWQAFVSEFADGALVKYVAWNDSAGWEEAEGVLAYGPPVTLTRATVLDSSNGGAAVNWPTDTVVHIASMAGLLEARRLEALPDIAAGDAGKVMQVKADESAFEMVNWRAKLHSHVYGGI